jgi:hypothetical protein
LALSNVLSGSKNFVDFTITPSKVSWRKKAAGAYRICSVTKRGDTRYINLRVPSEVQEQILSAYAQGKQVRIFS